MMRMKITGDRELIRELDRLETKMRRRYLRRAVTRGAKPIRTAAEANVPVRFGWLKKSLDVKVKAYRSGTVIAVIGPRSDIVVEVATENGLQLFDGRGRPKRIRPSKYAHLVEGGTKAHPIVIGGTAWAGNLGGILIQHPGSRGTAFMRRAFASQSSNALAELSASLRESLARGR